MTYRGLTKFAPSAFGKMTLFNLHFPIWPEVQTNARSLKASRITCRSGHVRKELKITSVCRNEPKNETPNGVH